VFEYRPTRLHAKSMVVDGTWSAVGSANFDNRSFQLNDEAVLCVQEPELAALLSERFEADLADSEEITLEAWRRRPVTDRVKEAGGRLLRREL